MARSHKIYGDWEQHDGKIVKIDGHNHRLRCTTYMARYPREELMIDVSAEAVNKRAKWYQEQRRQLGDDFSTDVLDSDIELQSDIMRQLGA